MKKTFFFQLVICYLAAVTLASGADDIGKVVALRGQAQIERNKQEIAAKVQDGILMIDTVATKEASRTKMLFIDDSVLTVGEKSKVVIKEFVYGKDDRSKAVFNLLDGKMRTVVGRSNSEVQTPTLVAAARGTVIYFETGLQDSVPYTTVLCLEGQVDVSSIDPTISGTVTVTPGMMATVLAGKAPPAPVKAGEEALRNATLRWGEVTSETLADNLASAGRAAAMLNLNPQQTIVQTPTTPVTIGVVFP
ncbi:MAG: FecR family protein [Candidatus Magnetobacterium sp. LHC-1]|uniref:FecR domain-containing protein n=1 Tax=Candidatus Magnetobacterium casense TaxID=1455061 RepID=A0ABS6RW21_9BACT|nr:FecR family protein [Candidatus Magnetobacterium casensis]MBF0606160.1 FecR domain-containing protein [Nitrospirota bacterium]MBV6340224.1 FecR domain-containing protein [Candidatus Magnetobacterium casensis]